MTTASRNPARRASGPAARAAAAEHVPPAERAARGKSLRRAPPRSSHASWEPRPDQPDPISLLEEQAVDRVPELVPIRYGRMSASPFAFYRVLDRGIAIFAETYADQTERDHAALVDAIAAGRVQAQAEA